MLMPYTAASPRRSPTVWVRALVLVPALAAACAEAPPLEPRPASAPLAARAGTELPFRGRLEAKETSVPTTGGRLVHLEGGGTATHLGRFTVVADFTLRVPSLRVEDTPESPATIRLVAANGDVLEARFTGQGVLSGTTVLIVEHVTIVGGTGRFAGATGSFVQTRTLARPTGLSSATFEGTISLAR
jgi:hypothetical protein